MAKLFSVSLFVAGAEVEFRKVEDRFEHTISVFHGDKKHAILRSQERGDDETAPRSPPFTQLHQQEGTMFLTGATTSAHWSMSVEVAEQRLVFDVACRLKAVVARLGSEYRVLAANGRELLDVECDQLMLRERTSDCWRFEPATSQPETFPGTIQWQYSIARKT